MHHFRCKANYGVSFVHSTNKGSHVMKNMFGETEKQYFFYSHGPWPFYLRDSDNNALIIVSRDEYLQKYADSMGIPKGKDGLTEYFESGITEIGKGYYIYNSHKINMDTTSCDFVISYRHKRYSDEFGISHIHKGAYYLKVIKMNNPSSIPDYIDMLHKNLEKVTGDEREEEGVIVSKIEKLLSKYTDKL